MQAPRGVFWGMFWLSAVRPSPGGLIMGREAQDIKQAGLTALERLSRTELESICLGRTLWSLLLRYSLIKRQ